MGPPNGCTADPDTNRMHPRLHALLSFVERLPSSQRHTILIRLSFRKRPFVYSIQWNT